MKLTCLNLFCLAASTAAAAVAKSSTKGMDAEELSEKRQQVEYERRKLDSDFIAEYTIVTESEFITFVTPKPLLQDTDDGRFDDDEFLRRVDTVNLLGSKLLTRGKVLKPETVVIEQTDTQGDAFTLFAGGLQPRDSEPDGNKNYFLAGSCTTIAQFDDGRNNGLFQENDDNFIGVPVSYLPTIKAHQCIYDLCLGGKGFNCINLYGGGGFIFNPVLRINQFNFFNPDDDAFTVITDNNLEPPLPPPFQLVIFGGTGAFRLVEGSAELITIAGRTRGNPNQGIEQTGVIVQNLITKTNIPLPEAKS